MLYWESIKPKTVVDVFNAPQVTITGISKLFGEIKLQALMVKWMNSFLRFYSVNGSMNAIQVADTIKLIIEQYSYYTMYDFKLFFNMAKKGMFGQIFGRMDGDVIMNWLKKYDAHRDKIAENENIRQTDKWKKLAPVEKTDGIYYHEYLELKRRAEAGDEEARKQLAPP